MIYLLATTKNTFGLVEYDHQNSIDYDAFMRRKSLKDLASQVPIAFKLAKQSAAKRIGQFHLIETTGPTLVSDAFRKVVEGIAGSDVEFLDASIFFEDNKIEGFSCIHPFYTVECMDMENSEYELTNFDPDDPAYTFLYMRLLDQQDTELHIARCAEFNCRLVVDDDIKNACIAAKLKGLVFYRALDMTCKNRTVGETS